MLVYFRDGLQRDGSPTTGSDGNSEHSMDDAGITEDIRHLLADLIDDVIRHTSGESDCTGRPSKRCATDILVNSPEPKRRCPFTTISQRTVFNPVTEHHVWCPYICDIGYADLAGATACRPWLRLLRQLVPDTGAALSCIQTSPLPEGIDRIRKLCRTWTSTA